MPNIVAHSHITAKAIGEWHPDIVLGSTLPDFAGMYKARYGGLVAIRGLNMDIEDGIGLHMRADSAFDSQPQKPLITEPMREDMEAAGIPYQAARLSADFAADVLLDRALLEYDLAFNDFRKLRTSTLKGKTALSGGYFPEHFSSYVSSYFRDEAPRYYADPRNVAEMIQHRLAARSDEPRRTIAHNQLRALGDVIGLHAERAGELGLAALGQTVEILQA